MLDRNIVDVLVVVIGEGNGDPSELHVATADAVRQQPGYVARTCRDVRAVFGTQDPEVVREIGFCKKAFAAGEGSGLFYTEEAGEGQLLVMHAGLRSEGARIIVFDEEE